MKDAPWFVDFFAPAIEDNPRELPAGGESKPPGTLTAAGAPQPLPPQPGKYPLGGSWPEVQKAELVIDNPLNVSPAAGQTSHVKREEQPNSRPKGRDVI